jgi:hypothetical protein
MVIHAVAKKWKISNTLYVVVTLKRENTYSGWLSSVKTVALKRENTQLPLKVKYFCIILSMYNLF